MPLLPPYVSQKMPRKGIPPDRTGNYSYENLRTPAKKASTEEPAKNKAEGKKRAAPQSDDGEDPKQIKLCNNRFVSVREFKNKVYVDIREFYLNNDGVRCPGKKGIMLSLEQWKKVAESADRITEMASAM